MVSPKSKLKNSRRNCFLQMKVQGIKINESICLPHRKNIASDLLDGEHILESVDGALCKAPLCRFFYGFRCPNMVDLEFHLDPREKEAR